MQIYLFWLLSHLWRSNQSKSVWLWCADCNVLWCPACSAVPIINTATHFLTTQMKDESAGRHNDVCHTQTSTDTHRQGQTLTDKDRHTRPSIDTHRQGQAGLKEKVEPCLAAWCGWEAVGWWPLSDRFAAFHSAPTLSPTGHFATENFSMSSKVWLCYGVAVAACCTTVQ